MDDVITFHGGLYTGPFGQPNLPMRNATGKPIEAGTTIAFYLPAPGPNHELVVHETGESLHPLMATWEPTGNTDDTVLEHD